MPTHTPPGFTFAGVPCGLKKTGALDLALVASDRPAAAAATFTQNRFPAAPVLYDRALLAENAAGLRAVAINAGCANACTGEAGLADAAEMAALAERALGLPPRTCAVMSTGVIGPRLPLEKIKNGVGLAAGQLAADGWDAAARAIMTTDTRPKVAFRQAGAATIFGMAKGAGMIHPNMATMLSVIVTDAAVEPGALGEMLRVAVDASFNCITVDGDTSTNDTVLILANGASGVTVSGRMGEWENGRTPSAKPPRGTPPLAHSPPLPLAAFAAALADLCTDLAQQIVRDGEGATKFITVRVEGALSDADARLAAKAVANSPLVKTAFYGGDANWGRILAAVGYSGAAVEPARTDLWIAPGNGEGENGRMGEQELFRALPLSHSPTPPLSHSPTLPLPHPLQLVHAGQPLDYSEETASAIFAGPEITVTVNLGLGAGRATVWTCDLSHEYVSINGHYRT